MFPESQTGIAWLRCSRLPQKLFLVPKTIRKHCLLITTSPSFFSPPPTPELSFLYNLLAQFLDVILHLLTSCFNSYWSDIIFV